MWGNAAMTIKGMEDKDIFVLAHSSPMNQAGSLHLYFLGVDRNESGDLSSHHINVTGGDQYFGHMVKDYYYEEDFPRAVAITAGDFDGDGYKNEIVVCICDSHATFAYTFSVTCKNGTDLTVTNIGYHVVDNHYHNYEVAYGHQPSIAAVAGDFDGDGVQEVALITRTNYESILGHFNRMKDIRVRVYKYTSSGWINEELNTFDDSGGTFKATRADLNGDGQDELVILVLHQKYMGGNISPRLEFWGFHKGSIKPVRNAHCNKTLGFELTGDEYSEYYKTAEDFSLTAGPLLGTRGQTKLVDDIAISHVNSEGSAVYVVPTILKSNGNFT